MDATLAQLLTELVQAKAYTQQLEKAYEDLKAEHDKCKKESKDDE